MKKILILLSLILALSLCACKDNGENNGAASSDAAPSETSENIEVTEEISESETTTPDESEGETVHRLQYAALHYIPALPSLCHHTQMEQMHDLSFHIA